MKIILSFFLTFASVSIMNAQNKRFFYEYKFAEDSANLQNMKKELMILDIGKEGSLFWSYEIFKEDSLRSIGVRRPARVEYEQAKVLSIITKQYPAFATNFYRSVNGEYLNILLENKINWKILPETKIFKNYTLQKATARIYKRNWIAWFAPDIPIQDGPYKFHGLPGLILKMEDEKGTQIFEYLGIENIANFSLSLIPYYNKKALKKVDEKYYKKTLENFVKNVPLPSSDSNNTTTFYNQQGEQVTETEFYRNQKKMYDESRKTHNNYLDLDIIK